MSETIELEAPAKINYALEVLGRRADGYHDIVSIIQSLDLSDRIRLSPATDLELEVAGEATANLPGTAEANLALRAAVALREAVRRPELGARLQLEKRIPAGTGLGGGSSDAAAVLLGLDRCWRLGLAKDDLAGLAATIGSDVPFFLHGGTSLASGRGEIIEPLPEIEAGDVTLFVTGISIEDKTRQAYAALLPSDFSDGSRTLALAASLRAGRSPTPEQLTNAFERSVVAAQPRVGKAMALCRDAGLTPLVCGSGPAFFVLAGRDALPASLVDRLLDELGLRAIFCRTRARAPSTSAG